MAEMSERLNKPISTEELERRWMVIRAAMAEEGIDVLLMQNNNDHMGGYVKYFTDMPAANGYPVTVVFPRGDAMTVVGQGLLADAIALIQVGEIARVDKRPAAPFADHGGNGLQLVRITGHQ